MTSRFGLFGLNTVVFPGSRTPLHVFEDRYRALVRDLLAIDDPSRRVFGITAIREGYEVGEPSGQVSGSQRLHRVGTLVQLSEVERYADGRFDIEVVARDRILISGIETGGEYAVAQATLIEPEPDRVDDPELTEAARRTLALFETYRARLSELRGDLVLLGDMPRDPTWLSWALAGTCLLTLAERQELLEADDTLSRLALLRYSLTSELHAMRAVPSLPATEVARMRWSPN